MSTQVLFCLICVLLPVAGQPMPQSKRSGPKSAALLEKQRAFFGYARNFIDFAKGDEYEPSSDLSQAGLTVADYAASASSLTEIYENMTCAADKQIVSKIVARDFAYFSKQLESEISTVNLGIAHTSKPGVAAEAIRMRDEMRTLKDIFDSTRLE